ncbi:hypothetical protein BH10BAC5_BH10BAC5_06170 [soil metagenome]
MQVRTIFHSQKNKPALSRTRRTNSIPAARDCNASSQRRVRTKVTSMQDRTDRKNEPFRWNRVRQPCSTQSGGWNIPIITPNADANFKIRYYLLRNNQTEIELFFKEYFRLHYDQKYPRGCFLKLKTKNLCINVVK